MQSHSLYKISGDVSSPYFARAKRCVELTQAALGVDGSFFELDVCSPEEWKQKFPKLCQTLNYTANEEETAHGVLAYDALTNDPIGGDKKLQTLLETKFGVRGDLPWDDYVTLASKAHEDLKFAAGVQASLVSVMALVVPPLKTLPRGEQAARAATLLDRSLLSASSFLRARLTQYDPAPHTIDAELQRDRRAQFQPGSPAEILAAEGLQQEMQDILSNYQNKNILVYNAPRNAAQWRIMEDLGARLDGALAIDVSEDLVDKEKLPQFMEWSRFLLEKVQAEKKQLIYVKIDSSMD